MQSCKVCSLPTDSGCPDCKKAFYCSQDHFQQDYASHLSDQGDHYLNCVGVRIPKPSGTRTSINFGDEEMNELGRYFVFTVHQPNKKNMGKWIDRLTSSFETVCGVGYLEAENLKLTLEYAREHGRYWTLLVMNRASMGPRDRSNLDDIAGFVLIQWPNTDKKDSAEIAYICARQFRLGKGRPFRVGRMLHLWAWLHMKSQGAKAVYLEATEDNAGPVYEALGYERSRLAYDKKVGWHMRFHFLEKPDLWGPLMRQKLGKSQVDRLRNKSLDQTKTALAQFQLAESSDMLLSLWDPLPV